MFILEVILNTNSLKKGHEFKGKFISLNTSKKLEENSFLLEKFKQKLHSIETTFLLGFDMNASILNL